MALGPWQIAIIALLVILLFGRGRISDMMGDLAKGITSFKKGLKDEDGDSEAPADAPRISASQTAPTASETTVEASREDNAG